MSTYTFSNRTALLRAHGELSKRKYTIYVDNQKLTIRYDGLNQLRFVSICRKSERSTSGE